VVAGSFFPDLNVAVDLLKDVRILDAFEHVGAKARQDINGGVTQRHRGDRGDRTAGVPEQVAQR
jgi:hypothetical protein